MGEINQYGPGFGVSHRLTHGAEASFEVCRDRHLQFSEAEFQTHITPLLPRGVVDRSNERAVLGPLHGSDHLGPHASEGTSHHNGNQGGHRCAANTPKPMGQKL
jgi:hypothetical protein